MYASIFATAFAYNTYSFVSKTLSPSVVTIYSTLQPVGTAVLSVVLFGKVIGLSEAVGGIIVALGLAVTVIGRRRELSEGAESGGEGILKGSRRWPSSDSQQSAAAAVTIIPFSTPFYRLMQQSEQTADEKDNDNDNDSGIFISTHSVHDIGDEEDAATSSSASNSGGGQAMKVPLLESAC